MAETFTVTQNTTLFTDVDGDGQFDPGPALTRDTVTTAVTITNNSTTTAATNIDFSETLTGLTLVAGSVTITPIAFDDSGYSLSGNTPKVFTASVLANDIDPDGPEPNLQAVNATNLVGGTVVLNTDGTFTFTPTTGFEGTASFEYTAVDAQTLQSVTTGTVTLTVTDAVWYVDSNYAGGDSDGSYLKPFVTLAPLNDTTPTVAPFTDPDGTNDTIFIYNNGTTYTGGITLEDGQTLHGDGQALTVNGLSIGVSASDAVLSNVGGTIVTLAQNNTLTGLTLENSATDITGSSFGTLTVTNVDLTGTGRLVNLSNGTANATFDLAQSSSSTTGGVVLSAVDGSITFGSTPGSPSIAGTAAGSTAFSVSGGSANIDFNGAISKTTDGRVIDVTSHTGTAGGGSTISFDGAVSSSGTGDGIRLQNNGGVNGTSVSFTGTLSLNTSTSNSAGFEATGGGTVTATGSGSTINSGTATALNISNTTIGAADVTFQSISSSGGSANGIILNTTGTAGGLHVTGTGAGPSGGTISNKTGANGSTTQGTGIYLNNTSDVQLNDMLFSEFENYAIFGSNVTGFTLDDSTINGVNGNNNAGGVEEGAIRFNGLFTSGAYPTASITDSSISGGFDANLQVWNTSGTLDRLTVTGNTFGTISAVGGNDNVHIEVGALATDTGTLKVTISNNSFAGTRADFIEVISNGNTTLDAVVRSNDFNNGQTTIPGGGTGVSIRSGSAGNISASTTTFDISNNLLNDGGTNAFNTVGIFVAKGQDGGTLTGTIQGNTIGPADSDISPDPGNQPANADGIFVRSAGSGTATVLILNNTITGYGNQGIHLQNNDGSSTMNASLFGNTLTSPNSLNFSGLFADNGATATDSSTMNLVVGSATDATKQNTLQGTGLVIDVSLSNFDAGTTFNLSRNGSAAGTAAGVIADDNVGTPSVDTTGGNGAITLVNTLPPLPPPVAPLLAAPDGVEAGDAATTPPSDPTPPADATPPAPPAPQVAAAHPVIVDDGVLSQSELDYFVDAAILRWTNAGLSAEQVAALEAMTFAVGDMSGMYLGSFAPGLITLDSDAAGRGWYLDGTPLEDSEFGNVLSATRLQTDPAAAPAGHFDVLTTVMHEMGHALGLDDSYNASEDRDGLMYGYLFLGERRLPGSGEADGAVAGSIVSEEFLGTATAEIDELPLGKAVRITFQSTIDDQRDKFITNPTNTGLVTADGAFPDANAGPETLTLDSLTLAGHIYNDADKDGYENGEGVAGVRVTLFVDTNHDGDFDLGTDLPITGGTDFRITDANGLYTFAGLAPGDYIVRVDQDNFVNTGGGDTLNAMVPYQVSVITSPEPIDPNANVDNDDNGARVQGAPAYTRAINLEFNQEPAAGAGNDTNTTLDLGFFANTPPTVSPVSGSGAEDQPARVQITLSGTDADLDTIVHFTIATTPANGQLWTAASGGTQLNAGNTVAATGPTPFTANVYFQPNANWSGGTNFTYTAFDGAENSTAAATASITISATADVSVTAGDVSGAETDATVTIPLSLSAPITDGDGSETLTNVVVTFTGAPTGMTATGGTLAGNVLTIPAANVGTVSVTVPADYAGSFTGVAVANTNEGNSVGASVDDTFTVTVSATAEPVTANDVGGTETDATVTIPLALSVAADDDGSETLIDVVVTFTGAPAGMTATGGTFVSNVLTIPAANVGTVSITLPADFAGSFTGSAIANSNEGASAADGFTVNVTASGDVSVTANDVSGAETDATVTIALSLSTVIDDLDSSETLNNVVVTFTGAPAGMTATGGSLAGNVLTIPAANVGTASITVPADYAGTFSGSAVANTNEGASAPDTFDVTVSATPEPITANDVGGTETDATVNIPLALSVHADADSSEILTDVVVTFTGAPTGMTATGGTLVGNVLTIPAANVGTVSITVPADFAGSFTGSAVANSNEGASPADGFTVNVAATGDVSVTANDVSGAETNAAVTIGLSLSTLLDDVDSSESLTNVVVTFTGAPSGMTATGGTLVGNVLTIPAANVATASITVPADFAGSFTGSAVANSNEGASAADGFTVNVTATGDVSLAANDVNGTETDATVTIPLSLSGPITDADGSETLTDVVITFTGAPAGMTATGGTLVANVLTIPGANVGTASITVPAEYSGSFTGSAVANTNEGTSNIDGFTVNVAATGDVSVTANDVNGVETNAPVTIALSLSTLVNDADASETLTNVVVTFTGAPAGMTAPTGVLVDNSGGSYTLTLTPAQVAGASITVPANFAGDFTGSAVANTNEGVSTTDGFTVHVAEVNDQPQPVNDLLSSVAEDSGTRTIQFADLTGNDSPGPSESGQTLTVSLTPGQMAGASGGTVAIVGGHIEFTPTANFFGTAGFDYTVTDNGTTNGVAAPLSATAHASFAVTSVNDAPALANVNANAAYSENGAAIDLDTAPLIVPSDIDDATMSSATIAITSGFVLGDILDWPDFAVPASIGGSYNASTGVLTINAVDNLANYQQVLRGITFASTSDNPGTSRTVTWTITDNGSPNLSSAQQTTTIAVTQVNDTPVNGVPASIGVTEDVASPLTGIVFADVDAGGGTVTATFAVPSGSLNAVGGGGVTVGGSSSTRTLTGTIANINAFIAGSNLTFTTAFDTTANVNLTVTLNDGGNTGIDPLLTGNGTSEEDTDVVTLTVTPVADIANDAATTNEDTAVDVPVLANDTFEGSEVVTGATNGTNGTVTFDADSVIYTPNADFNGSDSFTYTVTSGGVTETATVNVTVNAVADIVNDTASTNEDTAVDVPVLANDTFEGSDVVTGATNGSNGTVTFDADSVIYTPNLNFFGSDSFSYTVTSGGLQETATVNVTVSAVNDAPAIDLDASGAGTGFTTNYVEGGAAIRIVDTDVLITDLDDTSMSSAKIVLANAKPGDVLSIAGALPGGIAGSIDTSVPGQITVNLTNAASLADYQTAIGQIRFNNTLTVPDIADRDITVTVNDGDVNSNVAHATLHVVDRPNNIQDFNGDGKGDIFWTTDGGPLALWEMDGFQIDFADYTRLGATAVGRPGADWHVVDTGDVNGDGKTDILWRTDGGKLAVWLMDGNHIISADYLRIGSTEIGTPGADWHALGLLDADGNGTSDILWRTDSGALALWELDGNQITSADYLRSGAAQVGVPGSDWHIVGDGDFDGDGKGGLLWRTDSGALATWELDGNQIKSAAFTKIGADTVGAPGSDWHVVDVADFDGDGKSDILWRTGPPTPASGMEPGGGSIAIWEMDGNQIKAADFTRVGATAVGAPGPDWHILGADDHNGDGMADLLWRTDGGALAEWQMDGTQVIAADYTRIGPTAVGAPGADWHIFEHRWDLV
jgi:hypothetical protein